MPESKKPFESPSVLPQCPVCGAILEFCACRTGEHEDHYWCYDCQETLPLDTTFVFRGKDTPAVEPMPEDLRRAIDTTQRLLKIGPSYAKRSHQGGRRD